MTEEKVVLDQGYAQFSEEWWQAVADSLVYLPEEQRMPTLQFAVMAASHF